MAMSIFVHATSTTSLYTLSLHDALPISLLGIPWDNPSMTRAEACRYDVCMLWDKETIPETDEVVPGQLGGDRKSTRLNSSHVSISYAVFCLKKKKTTSTASVITNMCAAT